MSATVPWKMCRTCHRVGVRGKWYIACRTRGGNWASALKRKPHPIEPVGICGQCGKERPLVTCHEYDFRTADSPPERSPK